MDAILDTIDNALKRKGLTDAAASKLAVGHPALIKNLRMPRDGEKRYNLPSLMKLADVLDLELYFGPKRRAGFSEGPAPATNMDPSQDAPAGFLTIPWHEPRAGMGSAPVAFSRSWLDRNGLKPDFLQAIVPQKIDLLGLPFSDVVALIDTRIGARKGHGLWCFRDAGSVTIAHITFRGEITIIHPAHGQDEPRVYGQRAEVPITLQGRVVWMGQSVPLKGTIG
jgi:hypothetical protein